MNVNDNLVLVCGKSSTGKSLSLMGLKNQEGVMYLNCEAGKKLPFKSDFREHVVVEPMKIYEAFDYAETDPSIHTIIVDSLTYLMDMYEAAYVVNATDGRAAWGHFAQFIRNLMLDKVAKSTKNVIFIAHTHDQLNESEMVIETSVPIKGATKRNGVESFFSCIIATKKVSLKNLEAYSSPMLNITPEEQALGFKYVFQTLITKETVGERLRGPYGMWSSKETFIDNNAQHLMDKLHEYYSD